MPYKDIEMRRKMVMNHYYKNKQSIIEKHKKYQQSVRDFAKAWKQLCNCLL